MLRHIRLLLGLIVLVTLSIPAPRLIPRAHARSAPLSSAPASTSGPTPLPGGCGGGLPASANPPACCMFGYVYLDGQPVLGAHLTITSTHGLTEAWTELNPDNPQPYYRISLSAQPISVAANEMITITAAYGGYTHTIIHKVIGGGQHVDVVLPRPPTDAYVFDQQIWRQAAPDQINVPIGIAVDGMGTTYITDFANARVQVLNSSGQVLRQWGSLGTGPGQFASPYGSAIDQSGNVYVADANNHRIQVFSSTGAFIRQWGSFGSANGQFGRPFNIAIDSGGTIYVTDGDNHRVQVFDRFGMFLRSWGSFGSANGQFNMPDGIAVDASDNVYVVDTRNHRVQVFDPSGMFLRSWGSLGSANGQLDFPSGVAVDASGAIYVADTYNYRVQVFDPSGMFLRSWGSLGSANGQFYVPEQVAVGADGAIYVTDSGNRNIQVFDPSGMFLRSWASMGNDPGQFAKPSWLALDASDNIYVADTWYHRIQVFDNTGAFIRQWGSHGSAPGQFAMPLAVTIASSGLVYVADTDNNRIQVFQSDGTFVRQWGGIGSAPGQLNGPKAILVAGSDLVYVADTFNHRIQVFQSDGTFVRQWGGLGITAGQFNAPSGIAIDSSGLVYVADTNNHRIQVFQNDGTFVRQWGGQGTMAGQFQSPFQIALDSNGMVFVADRDNHRIQVFQSDGTYVTSWGSEGTAAGQFTYPHGVVADGNGNVYVADTLNNRIQRFHQPTAIPPIATIVAANPRTVHPQQPIVDLSGLGGSSVTTAAIAGYEWTLDGGSAPFATTADTTLDTTGVSPGRHTIFFRVRDTNGAYSERQSIRVDVLAGSPTNTWTFMLYLDADTTANDVTGSLAPLLSPDSSIGALYRLEHSEPNPNVRIAVLYDGPGDHDSTYYLSQPDGHFVASPPPAPEVDMGDPQTLIGFVHWAQQQAPADHYYLAIADHASGLDGIAWDYTSALDGSEHLTNGELRQALMAITDGGTHPIDVLHLDGCLMGLVEDTYQVRGLANYLVTSENEAWSAFAYDAYRAAIGSQTNARDFASAVADGYAQRVGVADRPYTIAALDLGQVDSVALKADALAVELRRYALASQANRDTLASVREQAQRFDSDGDYAITTDDTYIDLAHWLALVQNGVSDSAVQSAAVALHSVLPALVVREHHASGSYAGNLINLDNAHGVGIYYPARPSAATARYLQGDLTFPADTRWGEFLAAVLDTQPIVSVPPGPVSPLPIYHLRYLAIVRR